MDIQTIITKLSECGVGFNEDDDEIREAIGDDLDPNNIEDDKIQSSIPMDQLANLLFTESNIRNGKTALKKVIDGNSEKMSLRERLVMAEAMAKLLPIIAEDRSVYNKISMKFK